VPWLENNFSQVRPQKFSRTLLKRLFLVIFEKFRQDNAFRRRFINANDYDLLKINVIGFGNIAILSYLCKDFIV